MSPPPRPSFSSATDAAGDRYDVHNDDDDGDGDGYTSETPAGGDEDADGAEIVDSDDGGGKAATVSPKAKGGGGGKRRMEEDEEGEAAEDEEDEMEPPPAPRNPFARGGKTFASPPRKKRKVCVCAYGRGVCVCVVRWTIRVFFEEREDVPLPSRAMHWRYSSSPPFA